MKAADKKELSRILEDMEDMMSRIQKIHDSEEEIYESRSESWQESERGEAMYEMIYTLESAIDSIDEARDSILEVVE